MKPSPWPDPLDTIHGSDGDSSSDDSFLEGLSSATVSVLSPTSQISSSNLLSDSLSKDFIQPQQQQQQQKSSNILPRTNIIQNPPTQSLFSSSSSDDHDQSTPHFYPSTAIYRKPTTPRTIYGKGDNQFILGPKIGEGAYAIVREAIHSKSLRIVAVKVLDDRRLRKIRGAADAVKREFDIHKSLGKHDNLIQLIDVIRPPTRSKIYIILEMANGCTLQELADNVPQKQLPELQVANIAFQALRGLAYIHGKGVVHRDIKPANLMLNITGVVKISDFGVAEFLDKYDSEDHVRRTSGSPAFQAPEIAKGDLEYSGMKVDVWALGVTIYLLLTGKIPFHSETLLGLFDVIKQGEYDEPDILSMESKTCIRRMLTLDWHQRASVAELLRDPWIRKGDVTLSNEQKLTKGWVAVPRKEFGIMDVLKRMYNTDDDNNQQSVRSTNTTATASASQSPPTSQIPLPTNVEIGPADGENDRAQPCCIM